VHVPPYLDFDGRCDEALEFYKKVIGTKIDMLVRWQESPDKTMCTPQNADKVMHSQFHIGDTTMMASGRPQWRQAELSRDHAFDFGEQRSRDRQAVRSPRRRPPGADAARQDVFFAAFRHGCR
jgi:predicted 3-demethylubiquinone-9 3-methyltransferase (glyoxalase superfamily)